MSSEHLKILLGMLDDPDENSAVSVMGELLRSNSDELLPLLGDLQESNDPLMRKRIHELQSIIALRNRRRRFLELLESDEFDVDEFVNVLSEAVARLREMSPLWNQELDYDGVMCRKHDDCRRC